MLRECRRVLGAGGRIAGYVIHTPGGLSAEDRRRASALGPSQVVAPGLPHELARSAGLEVIAQEDVTAQFRMTCEAFLRARRGLEESLREEEGDEAYEDELCKKLSMLQGIDEGLLLRSLVVASNA